MREESLWGVGVVAGIAATLFGVAAVFWPQETIITLLYLFAAYILVDGVVNFFGGIFSIGHAGSAWFLRVILGALMMGVGVYLLRHPHVTFATLILLIGFTLIVRGVFDVVRAFTDRMNNTHRLLQIIVGVLAFIVGIYVLFQPVSGGVAFVWVLGLYALIAGPITIAMALDLRNAENELSPSKR